MEEKNILLTLYSSTSYFIYRGQEMGFQYELSEQFAKSLGLKPVSYTHLVYADSRCRAIVV